MRVIFVFAETFQLSGFDEYATIPITYPLDICLMEVNNNLYAVCLALDKSQNDTKTILKVLRKVVSSVITFIIFCCCCCCYCSKCNQ